MDTDLLLTVGLVIGALSIPSLLSAYAESRPPRGAAIMILIAGVLVVVALTQRPKGYTFDEIPHAVLRVISRVIN